MTATPPLPSPAAREPLLPAGGAEGWYFVKILPDTKRDFWMPAWFSYDDQRTGKPFWLDAWLDEHIEPAEIGPRIPSPAERPTAAQPADARGLVERLEALSAKATQGHVRAANHAVFAKDDEGREIALAIFCGSPIKPTQTKANAALAAALWNAYRAGQLTPAAQSRIPPAENDGYRAAITEATIVCETERDALTRAADDFAKQPARDNRDVEVYGRMERSLRDQAKLANVLAWRIRALARPAADEGDR